MSTPGQCLLKINLLFSIIQNHNEHEKNWVTGCAMKLLPTADLHSNPLQKQRSQKLSRTKMNHQTANKQLKASFTIFFFDLLLVKS